MPTESKEKMSSVPQADPLESLPTDKIPPTQEEKEMMSWLYSDPQEYLTQTSSKFVLQFRTILWLGLLFAILSFPQMDRVLHSIVPLTANSAIITMVIKTCLFVIVAWVIAMLSKPKTTS